MSRVLVLAAALSFLVYRLRQPLIIAYILTGIIAGPGLLALVPSEAVFDVIETAPRRLLEVDGIGATRLARITAGWADQRAIREIMVFLQSHGVGTALATRIEELADIYSFLVDQLGMKPTAPHEQGDKAARASVSSSPHRAAPR